MCMQRKTLYSLFSNEREIKLDFLKIRKSIKYIDKVKI